MNKLTILNQTRLTIDLLDMELSSHNEKSIHFLQQQETVHCVFYKQLYREVTSNEKIALVRTHCIQPQVLLVGYEEIEACRKNDGGYVRYHLVGAEADILDWIDRLQMEYDKPVPCPVEEM